jgi:hypothetical protein
MGVSGQVTTLNDHPKIADPHAFDHDYRRWGWFFQILAGLWILLGLGCVLAIGSVSGLAAKIVMAALAVALCAGAAGVAHWNGTRGVHTSARGIRNQGTGHATFTPWSDVSRFSIDTYGPGAVAVFLERKDGSREALQYQINWPFRKQLTEQFLRTMNDEFNAIRAE